MNPKEVIREVLFAILPITVVIAILQFTVIWLPISDFLNFLLGALLAFLGFTLFLIGVRVSLLPIGEAFGVSLMKNESIWFLIGLSVCLGFSVTIAEPGLQILADQIDSVSNGVIPKNLLVIIVSLGVGLFLSLALLRIIYKIPLRFLLIGGYIIVFTLALFAPPSFFAVAFDAGGATTGPMTVPFILALGVGMSSISGSKTASADSFGFVGLASIGPIISVLILGIIYQ
ncbi:MAG: DUF1538 domain-containing protein [Atribacterota bacterium]|nr:DUF1538 domain-containing protein [Atribacterota bacterium]